MADIGIIGWGYVGGATGRGFSKNRKNKVVWFDKYKKSLVSLKELVARCEFICNYSLLLTRMEQTISIFLSVEPKSANLCQEL